MTTTTSMECKTFEQIPAAITYLIQRVEELEAMIKAMEPTAEKQDRWMNIRELMDYLPDHPAKQTVYGWICARTIPHHKGAKYLRFKQSEIDEWLEQGKRKTNQELEAEASEYITKNRRGCS